MSQLTDQQASVVAILVEGVCYGIYLVTVGISLCTLLWGKHGESMKASSKVNYYLVLAICLVMPISATLSLSLNVIGAIKAIVPPGINQHSKDVGSAMELTRLACVNFQILVADLMLVSTFASAARRAIDQKTDVSSMGDT
ncbi:hypothetical protein MPER_03960 [Moniliophthora perniciosa FA553]|nr:hypothetical protein MPER_03960 [Moniliophthora perniciosa FA553]